VYIEAYGKDELYFSGPVRVNSTWDALTEGEKVEANTDIFTYEWIEGVGKGRMLQHVVFHSSCSQDMSITDQFGSQQLVEFDSFCDVSCSDGGCKEVTENGNTFGRRRISLFFESVTKLYLGLEAGSASDSVQLDQVIGLYTPDDFSSATQFFNFSDAIGKVLPPSLTLDPSDLEISPKKNYTIGAIVTGFLDGDTSTPCQQIGQSRLTCQKVEAVPCECPPCSTGEDSGKGGKDGKDAKKGSNPTPSPVPPPTPKPSIAQAFSLPTNDPSPDPTAAPSPDPSPRPVPDPTKAPSQASATKAPTKAPPTKSPTEVPPTKAPNNAPPTKAPLKSPPTKGDSPTKAPSKDNGNDQDNGKDAKKKASTIPFDGK
jgi:hypothetical protein